MPFAVHYVYCNDRQILTGPHASIMRKSKSGFEPESGFKIFFSWVWIWIQSLKPESGFGFETKEVDSSSEFNMNPNQVDSDLGLDSRQRGWIWIGIQDKTGGFGFEFGFEGAWNRTSLLCIQKTCSRINSILDEIGTWEFRARTLNHPSTHEINVRRALKPKFNRRERKMTPEWDQFLPISRWRHVNVMPAAKQIWPRCYK